MATLKDHILEIIGRPQLASLATLTEEGKPWVRYVMVTGDKDLSLRFASFLELSQGGTDQEEPGSASDLWCDVTRICGQLPPDPGASRSHHGRGATASLLEGRTEALFQWAGRPELLYRKGYPLSDRVHGPRIHGTRSLGAVIGGWTQRLTEQLWNKCYPC